MRNPNNRPTVPPSTAQAPPLTTPAQRWSFGSDQASQPPAYEQRQTAEQLLARTQDPFMPDEQQPARGFGREATPVGEAARQTTSRAHSRSSSRRVRFRAPTPTTGHTLHPTAAEPAQQSASDQEMAVPLSSTPYEGSWPYEVTSAGAIPFSPVLYEPPAYAPPPAYNLLPEYYVPYAYPAEYEPLPYTQHTQYVPWWQGVSQAAPQPTATPTGRVPQHRASPAGSSTGATVGSRTRVTPGAALPAFENSEPFVTDFWFLFPRNNRQSSPKPPANSIPQSITHMLDHMSIDNETTVRHWIRTLNGNGATGVNFGIQELTFDWETSSWVVNLTIYYGEEAARKIVKEWGWSHERGRGRKTMFLRLLREREE